MPVLGGNPVQGPTMVTNTGVPAADSQAAVVIDGTPVRVLLLAGIGAAGLFALKLSGFKFNVGVSN